MNKQDKKILSCFSEFEEKAYLLGQNAEYVDKNPFKKETNKWYNWNKGKNENGK